MNTEMPPLETESGRDLYPQPIVAWVITQTATNGEHSDYWLSRFPVPGEHDMPYRSFDSSIISDYRETLIHEETVVGVVPSTGRECMIEAVGPDGAVEPIGMWHPYSRPPRGSWDKTYERHFGVEESD